MRSMLQVHNLHSTLYKCGINITSSCTTIQLAKQGHRFRFIDIHVSLSSYKKLVYPFVQSKNRNRLALGNHGFPTTLD